MPDTILFEPLAPSLITGTADGGLYIGGSAAAVLAGGTADGFLLIGGEATGEVLSVPEEPEIPAICDGVLYLGGEVFGSYYALGGEADGGIYIGGESIAAGMADGGLYIGGEAWSVPPPGASAFLVMPPFFMSSFGELYFGVVQDSVAFSAPLTMLPTWVLRDMLALGAAADPGVRVTGQLEDAIAFGGDINYVLYMLIQERLLLSDGVIGDYTAFVRAVSRLILEGHAAGIPEALATIIDGLVLGALVDGFRKGEAADALLMGDTIHTLYLLFMRAVDNLVLGSTVAGLFSLVALVEDSILLGADLSNEIELLTVIRDSIGFAATLGSDTGEYLAWVLNTEGDKALSRYTNYPFNSFAKVGDRYYGAASDGVHRLEGSTDNSDAIAARLRAGLSNFGTNREKRLVEAFVGARTDGELLFWVIQVNSDTGEKEGGVFKVKPRPAQNTRETRVKTGRGWKAVQFDFVLENVDGADFDITSIEWRPLTLDRRTRG